MIIKETTLGFGMASCSRQISSLTEAVDKGKDEGCLSRQDRLKDVPRSGILRSWRGQSIKFIAVWASLLVLQCKGGFYLCTPGLVAMV